MARKPAAASTGAENFSDPGWTEDLAAGATATDEHFFGARVVHDERIPALARLPAKNTAQPHAAWRRIDQYRDDKRLRDLMREVYDE
jgi:hypothetical protein